MSGSGEGMRGRGRICFKILVVRGRRGRQIGGWGKEEQRLLGKRHRSTERDRERDGKQGEMGSIKEELPGKIRVMWVEEEALYELCWGCAATLKPSFSL